MGGSPLSAVGSGGVSAEGWGQGKALGADATQHSYTVPHRGGLEMNQTQV